MKTIPFCLCGKNILEHNALDMIEATQEDLDRGVLSLCLKFQFARPPKKNGH